MIVSSQAPVCRNQLVLLATKNRGKEERLLCCRVAHCQHYRYHYAELPFPLTVQKESVLQRYPSRIHGPHLALRGHCLSSLLRSSSLAVQLPSLLALIQFLKKKFKKKIEIYQSREREQGPKGASDTSCRPQRSINKPSNSISLWRHRSNTQR